MRALAFIVCLVSTILTLAHPILAQAAINSCSQLFSVDPKVAEAPSLQLVLNGQERSMRDLEPVFRTLVSAQTFDFIVPRNYRFNLTSNAAPVYTRHAEKDVDYFPYHLASATTDEARYYHDLLDRFASDINKLQFLQQRNQPVEWVDFLGTQYRFNPSPTTGKSGHFFAKPENVMALGKTVNKFGRPPFTYIDASGDWHITNKHFLLHLKERGIRSITLFRAHSGFDLFFYRLLLSKKKEEKVRRIEFADWLRSRNIFRNRPPLNEAWWTELIRQLEDDSEPTNKLLIEIAQKTTTSVMFTSITNRFSTRWMNQREISEIMRIKLDLERLPESYLEQVLTGHDLDIEIVMPFTTTQQIEAMRSALTILP